MNPSACAQKCSAPTLSNPSEQSDAADQDQRPRRRLWPVAGLLASAALAIVSGTLLLRAVPGELMLRQEAVLTMNFLRSAVLPKKPMGGMSLSTARPNNRTQQHF